MQQRRTEVLLITNPFLSPPFCNSLLLLVCHIPESSTSSAMSGVTITILFTSLLSNLTITYSSSDPWSCDPCTAYAAVAPATNASVAADSTTAANNGAKKNICLTSFFYLFCVSDFGMFSVLHFAVCFISVFLWSYFHFLQVRSIRIISFTDCIVHIRTMVFYSVFLWTTFLLK